MEVWQVAQRQLRAQGTWEKSDGPLLEAYCSNVVAARSARIAAEKLRRAGGYEYAGALKIVANAESAALACAKSLLLTADSRRRHGIKSPGKAVEDELAALIG